MNTYQTSDLCKPTGRNKIPSETLAYMRVRNRRRLYSAIIKEFQESGLKQADLARRLGKGTDVVCRWLSGPHNLEADTVSDLLFAINGGEADYSISYPLDAPARNFTAHALFGADPSIDAPDADTTETRARNQANSITKCWP